MAEQANDESVRTSLSKGVLTITLADHANRNALGAMLVASVGEAIDRANADDDIRAIVLTNEGTTWCAGANLKEQSARNESGAATTLGDFPSLLTKIQTSPTPVIGRIEGHVVGGGNGLAAVCDISIARDDVKFGFTEVRLGVSPAIISVVCLPKMRSGEAMEAFLRGNRFSAAKAAEYGLISRAVSADELDTSIDEVVADLRRGGPNALGIAKRLIYEVPRMEPAAAMEWAAKLSAECFASDEAREGMRAFIEKRDAEWI